MANRDNDRRRYREDDRYRDNERYHRQSEQFEDSYGQQDYREDRFDTPFAGQMGDRDSERSTYGRAQSRSPSRAWGGREPERSGQSQYRSSFGPSRYDTGEGRGFSSFTTEDQGGYGAAPGRDYGDSHDDRGFFERAGDEVASWFGDEDATRRRRSDHHRGRGPSNYTRSDERILEDACDALTEDWDVDARNIQVTVASGEVTLDGTVDSRFGKRAAEDCVDDVSGVKHVQNNLRVSERDFGSEAAGARATDA